MNEPSIGGLDHSVLHKRLRGELVQVLSGGGSGTGVRKRSRMETREGRNTLTN